MKHLCTIPLLLTLAACSEPTKSTSSDEHAHVTHEPTLIDEPDEYFYDCESAPGGVSTYATDESFVELMNKQAATGVTVDATQGAVLLAPSASEPWSLETPPEISFSVGPLAAHLRRQPNLGAPRRHFLSNLVSALLFEKTAHAHCGAVTGDNYLVQLRTAAGKRSVYSALLSVTTFTPNESAWRDAVAPFAGQELELVIMRAIYSGGTISNGPWVAGEPTKVKLAR